MAVATRAVSYVEEPTQLPFLARPREACGRFPLGAFPRSPWLASLLPRFQTLSSIALDHALTPTRLAGLGKDPAETGRMGSR